MEKKKLKVLYQINSLETVYAGRFIYEGYKRAFIDKGYLFEPFTSLDNFGEVLESYQPDIFISSLNKYNLKYIDLQLLKKYREQNGLVFFNQIRPWESQNSQFGSVGLKFQDNLVNLIKSGLAGDVFFHWLEQDDPYMQGFTKETGYEFQTILLAADKDRFFYDPDDKYKAEISFVGSNLPDKKEFFKEHLLPLRRTYDLKIYGSDWTLSDRFLGYVQKFGQYFNVDMLKKVRGLKLPLEDERKVYSSSLVSLNIHEEHQRKFGSDFNERTLKIPTSGGFEICDNVKVIRRYFTEDELVMAENKDDWFEKIDYFIKNPEKREPIIAAGKEKIMKNHTYHNRVDQIVEIYNEFKGN